ncbi:MAG: type 2 isopentenyl-diphosphate Delta-isomerase [Anaerolineae bacterium]|nr:type 2 isopentenyl-diphosphate Delta-isomerase [Anaerolineae bacterium]
MLPQRKSDHIQITLKEDVQSRRSNGLDEWRFRHVALPEINLHHINLACTFLGKTLTAPLLISSMTGGTVEAETINRRLAQTAQSVGIAMGLGSMRTLLEHPELASTYQVRADAPDILLFANLGAVQLNHGVTPDDCCRLVELSGADALILHLNPLQEAVQPEGDTEFAGLLARIEALCRCLPVPVVAKEVGSGIDAHTARQLVEAGVQAIDVAGTGGTSWALVEMYRQRYPERQYIAAAFANWGLPTAECIPDIRRNFPDLPLIASGGIRDGVDTAKCLALGADLAGLSTPFLKGAVESAEACRQAAETIIETLRITLFLTASPTLADLRRPGVIEPNPS